MEDLAGPAPKGGAKRSKAAARSGADGVAPTGPPEMLTPVVRASLTKQVRAGAPCALDRGRESVGKQAGMRGR